MPGPRRAPLPFTAVAALFYAAAFWGFVWYPLRALESAGMSGPWQLVVSYGAALVGLAVGAWPGLSGLGRRPGWLMALALSSGWANLGFVLAMLEGSVARALILFYLSPLWAALLGAWLLGERITRVTLASLALGLAGALAMLWRPEVEAADFSHADLLALTAGMAFAASNVAVRALHRLGTRQKTLVAWVGVVLLSLAAAMVLGQRPPAASPAVWGGAVLLGLGGFLSATLAVIHGVSKMPVQRSSVILLVEIPIGALSAWWLAGELLSAREWLGGGLILLAGWLAMSQESK